VIYTHNTQSLAKSLASYADIQSLAMLIFKIQQVLVLVQVLTSAPVAAKFSSASVGQAGFMAEGILSWLSLHVQRIG
jgi:hypothetical protein